MAINQQHLTAYRETSVLASLAGNNDIAKMVASSSAEHYGFMQTLLSHQNGNAELLNYLNHTPWAYNAMPAEIAKLFTSGILLGDAIRDYYGMGADEFFKPGEISWVGADTSLAPADIVINGDLWSLKDSSQILHNTSAASLANICLGQEVYKRGSIHTFAEFAPDEHDTALIYAVESYNEHNPESPLPVPADYYEWSKNVVLVRKTLSRWINAVTKTLPSFTKEFSSLKTIYNTEAGNQYLKHILPVDISKIETGKLLGRDKEHYYASIGSKGNISVGKIPHQDVISDLVHIERIYAVAGKQLDIYIEFANQRDETFLIQCEMRYSHGQFSSNPECKMKIAKNTHTLVSFLTV